MSNIAIEGFIDSESEGSDAFTIFVLRPTVQMHEHGSLTIEAAIESVCLELLADGELRDESGSWHMPTVRRAFARAKKRFGEGLKCRYLYFRCECELDGDTYHVRGFCGPNELRFGEVKL